MKQGDNKNNTTTQKQKQRQQQQQKQQHQHYLVLILDGAVLELADDKLLDPAHLVLLVLLALIFVEPPVQLDDDGEALAELVLQVLRPAYAAELTVDHDGQAVAQGLAFFHAKRNSNSILKEIPTSRALYGGGPHSTLLALVTAKQEVWGLNPVATPP